MNECSGIYLVYDFYSAIWIRIDMLQVFTCLCNALSYMICNLFGILSQFSNYFMPNTAKSSSLRQILALETFPLISSPEGPFGAYYKVPHRGANVLTGTRSDYWKNRLTPEGTRPQSRQHKKPKKFRTSFSWSFPDILEARDALTRVVTLLTESKINCILLEEVFVCQGDGIPSLDDRCWVQWVRCRESCFF